MLECRMVLCFAPAGSAVCWSGKPLADRYKLSQVVRSVDSVDPDWLIIFLNLVKVETGYESTRVRFFTRYHGLQPLARPGGVR